MENSKTHSDVFQDAVDRIIDDLPDYDYPTQNLTLSDATTLELVHVQYVIDGDTVEILYADGTVSIVRIIGIDCPETKKEGQEGEFYANEATEYAKSILLDKLVYLEKDHSDTDQYGRLLRYIWLAIPDSLDASEIEAYNFSALALSLGLAKAVSYGDDTKYADLFFDLDAEAQASGIGMWS